MRRSGIAATALLVALVIGMGAAAGASASGPVWAYCAKASPKSTGGYTDKTCTAGAAGHEGSYELLEGIGKGKPFKGANAFLAFYWQIPGKASFAVECEKNKVSGGFLAPNRLAGVVISMSKCTVKPGPFMEQQKETCSATTQRLSGELGWIDRAKGEAGVKLTNEAEPEAGVFADFRSCFEELDLRVRGSLIATWGPVGVITKEPTLGSKLLKEQSGEEDGGHPCAEEFFDPPAFEGEEGRHVLTGEIPEFPTNCTEASYEATFKLKGEALMVR